jgi:hypothetical protein
MPSELYMVAVVLGILVLIGFLARRKSLKDLGLHGKPNLTPVGGDDWTAEMGWRYVRYVEGNDAVNFQIEPMVKGGDIVYVPGEAIWRENAPYGARHRRDEILERLKSVEWNRELIWQDGAAGFGIDMMIPGTLESTAGGQRLEKLRLFHPGSSVSREEALERWHQLEGMFSMEARGEVKLFMDKNIPGSVFQEINLPILEMNRNVKLTFIKPE